MINRIAVILVRGLVGCRHDIKTTLTQLNLLKKHTCIVLDENESVKGMLRKAADFVTFGPITKEVEDLLIQKRGIKTADGKLKKVFHLAPPKGGFERKGIKKSFTAGGVLGDRGENMNSLIQKMI